MPIVRCCRILVIATLAACSEAQPPIEHTGLARTLLAREGYAWQTHDLMRGHVHYLPDSDAARDIDALATTIDSIGGRIHTQLALGNDSPIEVFIANSRAMMQELVERPVAGIVQSGERTAVLLYDSSYTPAIAHELTHLYTHFEWGPPVNGRWISEGLATLLNMPCQGHDVRALVKGLADDGKLRGWTELRRDFESIDEVEGNVQAASIVAYIREVKGVSAVRQLWMNERPADASLETGWRTWVAQSGPAARLDAERLKEKGCTP